MRLQIESPDFHLTRAMREFLETRVHCGLGHSDPEISMVEVHLSDDNGRRGGVDKRCRIRVKLHHQADVLVDDVESDLYLAMTRAADRAGRTVSRRLSRRRSLRRTRTGHVIPDTGWAPGPE